MNCFNHNDRQAIGLCKSCNKALCTDCCVDLGIGLACHGKCEEQVRSVDAVISGNVEDQKHADKYVRPFLARVAANFLSFAMVLIIFAVLFPSETFFRYFGGGALAIGVLIYGVNYILVRKMSGAVDDDA